MKREISGFQVDRRTATEREPGGPGLFQPPTDRDPGGYYSRDSRHNSCAVVLYALAIAAALVIARAAGII